MSRTATPWSGIPRGGGVPPAMPSVSLRAGTLPYRRDSWRGLPWLTPWRVLLGAIVITPPAVTAMSPHWTPAVVRVSDWYDRHSAEQACLDHWDPGSRVAADAEPTTFDFAIEEDSVFLYTKGLLRDGAGRVPRHWSALLRLSNLPQPAGLWTGTGGAGTAVGGIGFDLSPVVFLGRRMGPDNQPYLVAMTLEDAGATLRYRARVLRPGGWRSPPTIVSEKLLAAPALSRNPGAPRRILCGHPTAGDPHGWSLTIEHDLTTETAKYELGHSQAGTIEVVGR